MLTVPPLGPEGLRLSASQIDTFRLCPRKWAYSRVLPGRSNAAAELGTEIHSLMEDWVAEGKAPTSRPGASARAVACAMALVPHAPRPGTAETESDFRLVRSAATYTGRRDYLRPPNVHANFIFLNHVGVDVVSRTGIEKRDRKDEEVLSDFVSRQMRDALFPIVGDYKSTSDLKWAKDEETLRTKDVAAALYAEAAMTAYGTDRAGLEWPYVTTAAGKPPRTRVVRLVVLRAEVELVLRSADDTAHEMRPYHGVPVENVPRNASACEAFGGCPYLAECAPTASQRMIAHMTQASASAAPESALAARIRQRQGAAPAASAGAPVTPENGAPPVLSAPLVTPPAAPAAGGLAAKIAARKQAEAAGQPSQEAPAAPPQPAPQGGALAAKIAARKAAELAATQGEAQSLAVVDEAAPLPEPAGTMPSGETVQEVRNTRHMSTPDKEAATKERTALRDHFAISAMNAILSAMNCGTPAEQAQTAARRAYEVADAMLEARGK